MIEIKRVNKKQTAMIRVIDLHLTVPLAAVIFSVLVVTVSVVSAGK